MSAYVDLCRLLGAAEIALALFLLRDLSKYRLSLFIYLIVDATSNLIPLHLRDPMWWRFVWLPLCVLRAGLAVVESRDVARVLRGNRATTLRALVASGTLIAAAWFWHPENRFQALDVANQYARLAIFAAFSTHCFFARGPRTVFPRAERHAILWALWLFASFIASTKAKSGLLWTVFSWQGGNDVWLAVGIGCLSAHIALVAAMLRNEAR